MYYVLGFFSNWIESGKKIFEKTEQILLKNISPIRIKLLWKQKQDQFTYLNALRFQMNEIVIRSNVVRQTVFVINGQMNMVPTWVYEAIIMYGRKYDKIEEQMLTITAANCFSIMVYNFLYFQFFPFWFFIPSYFLYLFLKCYHGILSFSFLFIILRQIPPHIRIPAPIPLQSW